MQVNQHQPVGGQPSGCALAKVSIDAGDEYTQPVRVLGMTNPGAIYA